MTDTPSGPASLELARARTSLEAARLLGDAGLAADAVSRAYYAIFARATTFVEAVARLVASG